MHETTTIRVTKELYDTIKILSSEQRRTMQTVLEEALKEYKRQRFFEQMNAAFTRLKTDEAMWKAEGSERDEWEGSLSDGIEEE